MGFPFAPISIFKPSFDLPLPLSPDNENTSKPQTFTLLVLYFEFRQRFDSPEFDVSFTVYSTMIYKTRTTSDLSQVMHVFPLFSISIDMLLRTLMFPADCFVFISFLAVFVQVLQTSSSPIIDWQLPDANRLMWIASILLLPSVNCSGLLNQTI